MKKKVEYLIAAIFLLKQEKKRFYIVYSLSWVGKKKHKRAKFRERIFFDPAALQEFFNKDYHLII